MRAAAWLQHGCEKTQQLIDKKKKKEKKPETEEIKKNLPDNRGFRQVNKLRSEYHKRRIEVVWHVMGWNVILPSELIARLMTRNLSVGENKGRERYDYLNLVN